MKNNSTKKIEGDHLPSWISKSNIGYRKKIIGNKEYLLKFNLKSGIEEKICEVRNKGILAGVSSDGKYACFESDGFLSCGGFHLLDIENLKWSMLSLQGFSIGGYSNNKLVLSNSNLSIWAPSNNRAIFSSVVFKIFRDKKILNKTFLLEIGKTVRSKP